MRKITKESEPPKLTTWKRRNPRGQYTDLSPIERQAINDATRQEQFGLCAYCCKKIDAQKSHNEHIEARHLAPNRQLDFGNIVASCNTRNQCGKAHDSLPLPLTPLMAECETELKFYLSGKVKGLTPRSIDSIAVLGLNSRAIQEERKQMVDNLIFPDKPDDLQLLGDDLLAVLIDDFQQPDCEGQLLPFGPVLVNIIKQFLVT
ncbi:MAG: hypothetical protein Q8L79_11615 [Methylobacter sp.]|uniref:hypothetical protein n=1 Tax=Methylobacter sp. TaxID=2051955 RepID=UPI00272F5F6D|nr:hypothetical protein [Methylobacter sp.]MDP1665760.1 hypothetical protein [Methylobacter sp.]MDP1970069.1 hypothetical protein [Methylobacter sp.]